MVVNLDERISLAKEITLGIVDGHGEKEDKRNPKATLFGGGEDLETLLIQIQTCPHCRPPWPVAAREEGGWR
jgi:hypothetical protein